MISTIFQAATAINAATTIAAITSNNIANIRTPSFQASSTTLSDNSSGGVKVNSIRQDTTAGNVTYTGIPTDIAILGNGSYDELINTYNYTANQFYIDDFGNFLSPNGELLFTGAGGNVSLDSYGNLYSNGELIGTVTPAGNNGYNEPTGFSILSGYMISSNVNIAEELVNDMVNQRFFEANIITIQTSDEMLGTVINLKA